MSVTVHLRHPFSTETPEPVHHPRGKATLVDTRGQLLVLDGRDLDLVGAEQRFYAESQLIAHAIATYAEGEWSRAEVTE